MRKGFTLIELLAVIVILAIIALIATPIVLSIINDSKQSSGLRSAEMYIAAIEQAITREKMNNANFKPKNCIVLEGNLKCTGYEIIEIEVNGEKPNRGSIILNNGTIEEVVLKYPNGKTILKDENNNLIYGNKKYKNGEIVYFDVEKGLGCSEDEYISSYDETVKDYLNSNTGYNGFNNKASALNTTLVV